MRFIIFKFAACTSTVNIITFGYSVNKLANLSGISQSYLREVELGYKNPTVEILSILCDALNISLNDFFDEQETDNLFSDPLARIYRLSPAQRATLLNFLDTLDN